MATSTTHRLVGNCLDDNEAEVQPKCHTDQPCSVHPIIRNQATVCNNFVIVKPVIALLVILALIGCCSAVTNVNLRVGISLGLESPASDGFAPVQHRAFEGLQIWRDSFNNMSEAKRTTRDGKAITFELVLFENYGRFKKNTSNELFMREQMLNISNDPTLDYVLPPVGTPWGTDLRILSYSTGNVPFTVGIADSREYWYAIPGSYGAPTSSLYVMSSVLPYLRLGGAKTSYVVRMNETFQAELCQGFIDQAAYSAIKLSHTETVEFDYATFGLPKPTSAWEETRWNDIANDIVLRNDDVLIICDYGDASQYLISLLKERRYTPKAIVLSYKYAEFKDPSSAEFLLLPQGYHFEAGFPQQHDFVDSRQYNALVETRYGHSADFNNAQATLAGFLLSDAILHALNSSESSSVETALRALQLASFMGRARFDTEQRQLIDNLIIQRLRGSDQVIGPAIAAQVPLVYPMPTWEERVFARKWGHWSEIVGVCLMALGVIFGASLLVFLFVYRAHQTIIAASPMFCVLIIIGAMVIFIGNIFWMPNLAGDSTCAARAWVMPFGFMLLFGSLVAKTHRIAKIFNKTKLNMVKISNMRVLVFVLAILTAQFAMSLTMMLAGDIKSHIHVVDEWRPSKSYYECKSKPALKYLYGVNLAGGALLLLYGSILAVKVRKVPWRIYDESTIIHYATFATVGFTLLAVVIQLVVNRIDRFISYFIVTLSMFLGPVITLTLLFYSKYRAIYDPYSSSSSSFRNNGRTGTGMLTSSSKHTVSAPKNASGGLTTTESNDEPRQQSSSPMAPVAPIRKFDYSLGARRTKSMSANAVEMERPLSKAAIDARIEELRKQRRAARKEITKLESQRSKISSTSSENDNDDDATDPTVSSAVQLAATLSTDDKV